MAATPVVCIPGTLCDGRIFQAITQGLEVPVIHWRYHQFGESMPCSEWAADMLKHLPPRFAVMGFSLGGLLALALSDIDPDRVAGLALVASNAEAGRPAHRGQQHTLLKAWDEGGCAAVVAELLPRYGLRNAEHSADIGDMALQYSQQLFAQQLEFAANRPDRGEAWRRASGPALIISGQRDTLCPSAVQARLKELRPDAHWLDLADSGHFLLLDAPQPCRAALRQWAQALNRCRP
jgi:pimeloyl-ACP methyl ester carboxylesterase